VALLRRAPATDPQLRAAIQQWLTELGCADTLYLDWTPPSIQDLSDTPGVLADSPDSPTQQADISANRSGSLSASVSDTVTQATDSSVTGSSTRVEVSDRGSGAEPCGGQVSATVSETSQARRPCPDTVSDNSANRLGRLSDMADGHPPVPGDLPDTSVSDRPQLSVAVDIVRTQSPLSGSDMAKEMALRGHPMSERTGLRWRNRATKTAGSANSWSPPAEHSHRSPTSAAVTPTSKGPDSPFSLRVRVGTFFA